MAKPGTTESPRARSAEAARRLAGIGLMMATLVCFTGIDTSAKWLARDLPPLEITFFRYCGAFLLSALVFNPVTSRHAWRSGRPGLQAFRALMLLGSTLFNFMALRSLQLAETMSIVFAVPFVVAILSVPLLGEKVGRGRWGAIVLGFVGVLLVTRPTPSHFDPAMLWAFGNVGCYALYVIVTRLLSRVDSAASLLVWSAGLPVLFLAPFMPAIWVMPSGATAWVLLAATGVFGALGHFFLILAFTRAPASMLSPFIYTQIVWMTLSGWLVFGDVPGGWTIAGASVVVASGLWLVRLEHERPKAAGSSAA